MSQEKSTVARKKPLSDKPYKGIFSILPIDSDAYMPVVGDWMEHTFKLGSIVALKIVKSKGRRILTKEDVYIGECYLVQAKNGLSWLRRVAYYYEGLKLVSDKPQQYPEIIIKYTDIQTVYLVQAIVSLCQPVLISKALNDI